MALLPSLLAFCLLPLPSALPQRITKSDKTLNQVENQIILFAQSAGIFEPQRMKLPI